MSSRTYCDGEATPTSSNIRPSVPTTNRDSKSLAGRTRHLETRKSHSLMDKLYPI